jgi:N-methylhydantoinase A/oxoprolinase/acetone carboxylase beta subunit
MSSGSIKTAPAADTVSIGIDVGGTFTDLVSVGRDGSVSSTKVLSTPADQSVAVERALQMHAVEPARVERIVHGTTVVTNMLLERRGARVVLCATAGATDLLELRRQERAALYDLARHHPEALVPPQRVVAVRERIAPEGVLADLTAAEAERVASLVAELHAETVAISLLHSYLDPAHEWELEEVLRARLPGVDVVRSSAILPEIREYERTATTVCEAYARPGVRLYLERLVTRLTGRGYPSPGVVQSNGGFVAALEAARSAASLALSGPAGGVAGAALVARLAGYTQALTLDMGGTSADVGLVLNGEPLVEAGGSVAGVPIALPRVLVETVSSGGGSVAWIDDGGALRVGPRSAGAVPGPVAFGCGGREPTVTDAHVALGNIRAAEVSGAVRLDADGARAAVATLAARLGASVDRTARAIIETADAAMARALRRLSVERGIDPRSCVLVAFGGGGPLHACGLAERLGISTVLVPPHAGVLSALGLAVAPERRVAMASVMRRLDEWPAQALAALTAELRCSVGKMEAVQFVARMRYRGQGHELEVPFGDVAAPGELARQFTAMHATRYGFNLELPIEVVSLRCVASGAARPIALRRRGCSDWRSESPRDDGGELDVTVRGPCAVALPDATMLVAAGWRARTLPIGGWLLSAEDAESG